MFALFVWNKKVSIFESFVNFLKIDSVCARKRWWNRKESCCIFTFFCSFFRFLKCDNFWEIYWEKDAYSSSSPSFNRPGISGLIRHSLKKMLFGVPFHSTIEIFESVGDFDLFFLILIWRTSKTCTEYKFWTFKSYLGLAKTFFVENDNIHHFKNPRIASKIDFHTIFPSKNRTNS